jgi:hypothetical protein
MAVIDISRGIEGGVNEISMTMDDDPSDGCGIVFWSGD